MGKVESYNTVKYAKYWKLARGDPRLHIIERRRCKGRSGTLRNRHGECKESPSSRQPLCADFRRYGQGHGTLTRTYIAYYIFPKSSDKADEKLQDVTTALKWMPLQIAQDDILIQEGNGKPLWYGRLPRLQLFALCYSVAETRIWQD